MATLNSTKGDIKLFVADTIAVASKLFSDLPSDENKQILRALEAEGVCVRPNFISTEKAIQLCAIVKELHIKNQNSLQVLDGGGDQRFYGIDRYSPDLRFFLDNKFFDELCFAVQGYRSKSKETMSNILRFKPDNVGSGGGWHRDSPFTNQFKAFLFLTDVSADNGPLTIIRNTHTRRSIRKVSEVLGVSREQYRFSDEEVKRAVEILNLKIEPITCSAGTLVLANTRILHRGSSLKAGERVALTNYYYRGERPEKQY